MPHGNGFKAEVAERDVRSINYQMKAVKLPTYRYLAGFDFAESAVDDVLVRFLSTIELVNGWNRKSSWANRGVWQTG